MRHATTLMTTELVTQVSSTSQIMVFVNRRIWPGATISGNILQYAHTEGKLIIEYNPGYHKI